MTSRERVLRAIEHKKTDRYPIDLGMHFSTGISVFAYYNLRKYLGLSTDTIEIVDMVQMLARVDEDILEMFHIDTMLLYPRAKQFQRWNPRGEYTFLANSDAVFEKTADGGYTQYKKGAEDLLLKMPENGFFFDGGWPEYRGNNFEEVVKRTASEAERLYHETDKFLAFMEFPAFFGGLDWMCDLYTDGNRIKKEQEAILKKQIRQADYLIKTFGDHIQMICLNSDLGTQMSPWIGKDMYDEYVFPYVKRFCEHIKSHSDYKIFLHSCGSIEPLIPSVIAAGVDVLNPVQISAANMDPEILKERYGKEIAFWGGGADTQKVLNLKDADDVAKNVKYLTDIFKKGGGFVFNQVHNIMGDIKPENIVSMLKTAYDNSFYVDEL